MEAYHGGLRKFINSQKPAPLACIKKLGDYHKKVRADMFLLRVGQNPRSKQRKQWQENDERKRGLALNYNTFTNKLEYVKAVAATFI